MPDPYVGEIRMFAGTFAPVGWEFCSGQLVSISENEVLYQLIGTTYGGDGQSTFALPNLQGRIPIHQGNGFVMAETGGVYEVTLATAQIPVHSHAAIGSAATGQQSSPGSQVLARATGTDLYGSDNPFVAMAGSALAPVGGSQPHSNVQPYLCVNFIISMYGVYPSPT